MSFEKLALVRMRSVGGDPELGQQVERIRDDLIYAADSIDLSELKWLRNKQLEEKSKPGKLNAKFSPGGLVDLEYAVQILQVTYGRSAPKLRTPRIHQALEALVEQGEIDAEQSERLVQAYRFLRNLINGLRMLRGNAQDLFLPPVDSLEYMHLARRAGYESRGELTPAERLHMEFEARTADVRVFVERELGRDALPGDPRGTVADLILGDQISEERRDAILSEGGFTQQERSYRNVRSLAGEGQRRYRFAELAILAWDTLGNTPDPDMALNNWDRFAQALEDVDAHFEQLSLQPKRLEVLLQLFAGSQFLADTLIRNPDFFDWVTEPSIVTNDRTESVLYEELVALSSRVSEEQQWKAELRRFRRREICRIGTRDIALGIDIRLIMTELSNLARALCRAALHREEATTAEATGKTATTGAAQQALSRFAVLAFGKLGGRELNYSSDIDLLGIFESSGTDALEAETATYSRAMRRIRDDLGQHTEEGYAYRIDFRLRPFGSAGPLVHSLDSMQRYYEHSASLWEYQALLKLSPVAGNLELARTFLERTKPHFQKQWDDKRVVETIRDMRTAAVRQAASSPLSSGFNVKTGEGGIRDVEFLVQGMQMIHSPRHPELLVSNTVEALALLRRREHLSSAAAAGLEHDYLFLRRLEHFLQIFQDRQVHALPKDEEAYRALANRMKRAHQFEGEFDTILEQVRARVRSRYEEFVNARTGQRSPETRR
jgi:glutamate-ammonia-ligase adenylyltransferase